MSKCGVCGETFKNKRGLRMHKKRQHGGYFTTVKEDREKSIEQSIGNSKSVLTMSKEKAQLEWKNYRDMLVRRGFHNEKYIENIKKCLTQMKKGRKIIDIYVLFKEIGLDKDENPKIAIARADAKNVTFEKSNNGRGTFYDNITWRKKRFRVSLPQETFNKFSLKEGSTWEIKNKEQQTKVPIIPVEFLPRGKLENYYILWEVEEWKPVPPKDPVLLKKITDNLFSVLAVWDLTPLEMSIIRGQ